MQKVDELLANIPAFEGMGSAQLELAAGCGGLRHFKDGEYLLREGERADFFYVVRVGTVAIETFVPQRGPVTLETLHEGELLGWSWLVPPYRTVLDARALGEVSVLSFDGTCLRGKCEADHAFGYELMTRFVPVIIERLQATRLQLLDVYGTSVGA